MQKPEVVRQSMSSNECAIRCRLEAAVSGESFGCVDIPDELFEDCGGCFDLQRLVHTVLIANHARRSCAKSSELLECGWACTEACHLTLFDEHNGPELVCLNAKQPNVTRHTRHTPHEH